MGSWEELRLGSAKDGVTVEIHARPKAKKSRLGDVRQGALEVSLAAPPVDGAANRELVAYLSERLNLAKRDVILLRGEGSRTKLVLLRGLDPSTLRQRLAEGSEGGSP